MTKANKQKFEKRVASLKRKPVFFNKTITAAGKVSVSGTKALSNTAAYTPAFCREVLRAWKVETGQ